MGLKSSDPLINFATLKIDKLATGALTITQPVFAGGRIVTGNKLAKIGANINESRLVLSKDEVLLKTEQQYWQIVALNEKLKSLHLYASLLDSLCKQANDSYAAGLINKNDVLKVTIKQNEIKINRLKLENAIRLASMALCQYIGIVFDSTMTLSDTLSVAVEPAQVFIDIDKALPQRQEYRLIQQGIEAEKLKTSMKRGEYLPEIGVGASEYYTYLMDKNTLNGMVFASVKIPLSNWWGASHALNERKNQEEMTANSSKNNLEQLRLQIQKEWNNLVEQYQQIDLAGAALQQAQENVTVNANNYKAGLVNISDMLEAQAMLQDAHNRLSDARADYRIALITYMQVTGRSLYFSW